MSGAGDRQKVEIKGFYEARKDRRISLPVVWYITEAAYAAPGLVA
jgi:hypothetical protein